jgi:hypothetical protein
MGADRPLPVYQVLLRGPTKVEYLFLEHSHDPTPAREPGTDTLPAIDTHFWDWILWLEQKRRAGRDDVLERSLKNLHELLLGPMGVVDAPRSVAEAATAYVAARAVLEARLGVGIRRELEDVVRPVLG